MTPSWGCFAVGRLAGARPSLEHNPTHHSKRYCQSLLPIIRCEDHEVDDADMDPETQALVNDFKTRVQEYLKIAFGRAFSLVAPRLCQRLASRPQNEVPLQPCCVRGDEQSLACPRLGRVFSCASTHRGGRWATRALSMLREFAGGHAARGPRGNARRRRLFEFTLSLGVAHTLDHSGHDPGDRSQLLFCHRSMDYAE